MEGRIVKEQVGPDDRDGSGRRSREERDRDRHPQGKSKPKEGLHRRLWYNFQRDDVLNMAAGLTYFAFLSFPPLVLVIFTLAGLLGDEGLAVWLTEQLGELLPEEAGGLVEGFVQQVIHQESPGLLSIGLLLAIWAASNVFVALVRALNIAYDAKEERSFVKQRLTAIGVMFIFFALFLGGSFMLVAGPYIAGWLDLFGAAEVVWNIVQWPLAFLLIVAALWVCYYVLPARDQARHKSEIFKGAVAATALWLVATVGFRIYTANFGAYGETYGILGSIIVFLLWLYITNIVLIMGGELAAELEEMALEDQESAGEPARA